MDEVVSFRPKKSTEVYIVELIKMDKGTLVKRLSDDTIWCMSINLHTSKRKWENITT